jgi:thioredoxin-dependent peroxiredoxin
MQTLNANTPALRDGKMVPLFSLPSAAGGSYGPGALRSKYNMVLAFVCSGPDAESYLRGLAETYPEFLGEQARVIAVLEGDLPMAKALAARLSLPFPLLADSGGEVTRRMLGEGNRAGLCVADRFGEVVFVQAAPDTSALPSHRAALEWLEYIQVQCPE